MENSLAKKIEEIVKTYGRENKSVKHLMEFQSEGHTYPKRSENSKLQKIEEKSDDSHGSPIEQIKSQESSTSEKLNIEDTDRRRILTSLESSDWPFCSIGKITGSFIYKGNSERFFGTGTLIGPNVVLTCAHNVYDLETKKEHFDLTFYPAISHSRFKHSSKVVKFIFPEEYKNYDHEDPNRYEHDYAVLFLDKNLDYYYGYLGLRVFPENSTQEKVALYGYSGCNKGDRGKNLVGMEGEVNLEGSMFCCKNIDTYYGQSGSALIKKEGKGYYITGIHVCSSANYNKAVKINAEALLRIKAWTVVEINTLNLLLSDLELGDESFRHLFEMNLPPLKRLDSCGNKIGNNGIKYLSAFDFSHLVDLNLSYNLISGMGIKYLSELNLPELDCLDLRSNDFGDEGMVYLSKMDLLKLRRLNLSTTNIGDEGIKYLSEMNLPGLTSLNIESNKLGSQAIQFLSQMNLNRLLYLDLSVNQIGDEGMKYFSTIHLPVLNDLDLKNNLIGGAGLKYVLEMNLPNLKDLKLDIGLKTDEYLKMIESLKPSLNINYS